MKLICIDGVPGPFVKNLNDLIDTKRVLYDLENTFEYSYLDTDAFVNAIFNLEMVMKYNEHERSNVKIMDGSPLSSVFRMQINAIAKLPYKCDIEEECKTALEILFQPKTHRLNYTKLHQIIWKAMVNFNIVICNVENIYEIATFLLHGGNLHLRVLAMNNNLNFDFNFCTWYATVQYVYFKMMCESFITNVVYFPLNTGLDFISKMHSIHSTAYDKFVNFEVVEPMIKL